MTLLYIVLATTAGGVLSVTIAAGLTVQVLGRLVKHLVSLSAGVLLGTALLHVLPEAFEGNATPHALFLTLLVGLLLRILRPLARILRPQKCGEHEHLRKTSVMTGCMEHSSQTGVHRQCSDLLA